MDRMHLMDPLMIHAQEWLPTVSSLRVVHGAYNCSGNAKLWLFLIYSVVNKLDGKSKKATISKEDSDLLFKTQPMESVPELEQVLKLGEMEEIDYIVNRAIGDDKKAQDSKNIKPLKIRIFLLRILPLQLIDFQNMVFKFLFSS